MLAYLNVILISTFDMRRKTPPVRGTLYLSVLRSQHPVGMSENSPVIHHQAIFVPSLRDLIGAISNQECVD